MNKTKKKLVVFPILAVMLIILSLVFNLFNNKSTYDNPLVPEGFKIIDKDTTKGMVIEDKNNNQFVWVPVNNKKITLSRKTFVDNIKNLKESESIDRTYYGEEVVNSVTYQYKEEKKDYVYDIDYFKESVKKYGGFYISRYEIGDSSSSSFRTKPTKGTLVSKKGYVPYNYVSRDEALSLSMNMYKKNSDIVSTLINSYAWDTLLEYISTSNKDYVFNKENNNKKEISKTGENNDKIYNIYDLSGNVSEWTTEYSSVGSYEYIANCVYRGESFDSSSKNPATRNYNDNVKNKYIGFRVILYF